MGTMSPRFAFSLAGLMGVAVLLVPGARAAQLKILSPPDRSLLRGHVQIRIAPGDEPRDQFLENPRLVIQDGEGRTVRDFRPPRDAKTQICSAVLDSTALLDGQYHVTVTYRTLVGGKPVTVQENLTVAVRNGPGKPGRFTFAAPDKPLKTSDSADLKVTVLDGRGKPFEGARVVFKATSGDLQSEVEITDRDGEAFVTLESEDAESVSITATVEGLAPQSRVVRFVE